jgi:hypothetical protein
VFIEGRSLTKPVALHGEIKQVRVNLHNAGFGIKTGDFDAPSLWFAHSNSYARFDPEAGVLDIAQRPHGLRGQSVDLPKLWLDLPHAYRELRMDEVDIRAQGYTEVNGLTMGDLSVETWGEVVLMGLHIGHTCLAKSIRGNVAATRLDAPETADPERWPSVQLISLSGAVSVAESTGSWRLSGLEVDVAGAAGPQFVSVVTPLDARRPVQHLSG